MNQIHTDAVLKSIDDMGANPLLGTRPPLIDRSEPEVRFGASLLGVFIPPSILVTSYRLFH